MAKARRIGIESSATRALLLDAASRVIQQYGYAALTSRRVASEAGQKPQLVHYYFRTMDDLLLALVRRGGDEAIKRLARAVASKEPLRALWKLSMDPVATVVTMEIMAVANHHDLIRAEARRYAEQYRNVQAEAISQYLETVGIKAQIPPLTAMLMMAGISQVLLREKALGMTLGHQELESGVENWLQEFGIRVRRSSAASPLKKNSPAGRENGTSTRRRKPKSRTGAQGNIDDKKK
jgi:AcrR family transcriptional regulator